MRKYFPLLLFVIVFSSVVASATDKFGGGVAFDLGVGTGHATIKNPDDTDANYKILAVEGKGMLPLFESESFAMHLTGGVRYLDLENSANSDQQREVANMIGPGAGLQLRLSKFFVGGEYHFMLARHYAIGEISRSFKYDMPTTNLYAGFAVPFKQLSISFVYSQATGTVPKDKSGLSADSAFNNQIYWLHLTYSTGASFAKFWDFLF